MDQSACRPKQGEPVKTNLFFPERGQSLQPGKAICAPCPVQAECQEYRQRTNSNFGMWGGKMTQRHRSS